MYAMKTQARSTREGCPHSGWVHAAEEGFPVLVSDDKELLEYWLPRSLGEVVEYTGDEQTMDIYDAWVHLRGEWPHDHAAS